MQNRSSRVEKPTRTTGIIKTADVIEANLRGTSNYLPKLKLILSLPQKLFLRRKIMVANNVLELMVA